jgi:hypothetical protein
LQQNNNRNNTTNNATTKVINYFPVTNKDFSCTELHTPDGIYPLLHETFYETIAPQFSTGTRASIASCVRLFAESSEDDDGNSSVGSSSLGASLSMTPVIKSAALPIPTSNRKQLLTSSSTSSMSTTPLHIVTSPQRSMTTIANGNNASPYLPRSPSFPNIMTPTTPTSHLIPPPNVATAQQATGSYMMSSSQDLGIAHLALNNTKDDYSMSSSYGGNNSSVGSLTSLFGRSASTSNINKPQLSTSSRNNNIMSTSMSTSSKPKNTLLKTNSAFVQRFLVHENLQKLLSTKSLDDNYLFFNIGSSFIWVDANSKPKVT